MVTGPPRQTRRGCRSSTPATPVCHTPLLFTPPFPDHPSGHASATAAFLYSPELLRHRQDWLQRVQQQILHHAEDRAVLRRAQGGHRCSRVGRHPLPHRRHARCGARQQSCPLPQEALLPASPRRPIDQSDSGNCKPSTDWSSSTARRPQPRGVAIRGFPQVSRHFRMGSSNPAVTFSLPRAPIVP
jgi:hypothetical protein